jgi:hypothetical protein
MALSTALFAYLGRQLSTLLQAVLGWSVTALFGRLPSMKQTALTVALLLSLLWPIAVVGVFVPAVSAWAFAFLPLQKWLGEGVVRWSTLGIAIVLPLITGTVTRWVAPLPSSSMAKTILSSYSLTVGYAVACVVTAMTVPLVKLASAIRGWSDEHVFVQPRAGEYDQALEELALACAAANLPGRIEPVPGRMRIASTVLKWLSRGAVHPIVADEPKVLRADGLEAYLYPADLLLRGKPAHVARVRATMTRTWLERFAFTVSDPGAQKLQEEMQRMWHLVRRHANPRQIGAAGRSRLREIAHDLDQVNVPFEQWVTLDRSLHRLERALGGGQDILKDDLAVRSVWRDGRHEREERAMEERLEGDGLPPSEEPPAAELIREALEETRDLVRIEIALAREEIGGQLAKAKVGAIALGAAAALALLASTMALVAMAAAFACVWIAALVIAGILLIAAGVIGLFGWRAMPKRPLAETRGRLESDLEQLKERIV